VKPQRVNAWPGWLLCPSTAVRAMATAAAVLALTAGAGAGQEDVTVVFDPDVDPGSGGSYPRVIQIQHHEGMQGDLLLTFAHRPNFQFYRSTDNGETWQMESEIPELGSQPSLLELPHQVGEFPAGTIMAAGMHGTEDGRQVLSLYASSDGGGSWEFVSDIVVGTRGPYNPDQRLGITRIPTVWEPTLALDHAGRLMAYYATERHKDLGYNQASAYRTSPDGGRTWGEVRFLTAVGDGYVRPGMPVVTDLPNGRIFAIYEIVSAPWMPIEPPNRGDLWVSPVFFKISDPIPPACGVPGGGPETCQREVTFGDPGELGTLILADRHETINATPYIVWSPWGGENGTLIAVGRETIRNEVGKVGNGALINRNLGQGLWEMVETPITYEPGNNGYSQVVLPIGDGREILHFVPVDGRILMARWQLPEPGDAGGAPSP